MRLPADQMMRLMAYVDGELEETEKSEVEALLARDEAASAFVEALSLDLGQLTEAVHAAHDTHAASKIETFDVTMAVLGAIAGERRRETRSSPVERVDAPAGASTASQEVARAPVVSLARARATRLKIGGAVAIVFAAAAAFFLFARPSELPMAKSTPAEQPAASGGSETAFALGADGVEVEAVQSAGHSVSVYYLPTANQLSTSVVVWVDETGEK